MNNRLIILTFFVLLTLVNGQSGDDTDTEELTIYSMSGKSFKTCYLDGNGKCQSNGRQYAFLESWLHRCHKCTCYDDLGILCCDMIKMPTDWPPDCFPKVDRKTCTVHLKSTLKPNLDCDIKRMNRWRNNPTRHKTAVKKHIKKS